jgi:hypothetical protein
MICGRVWLATLGRVRLDQGVVELDASILSKILDVLFFVLGPLHPPWITAGLRLQLEVWFDVLDEVSSFASLVGILHYFIFVELVDF